MSNSKFTPYGVSCASAQVHPHNKVGSIVEPTITKPKPTDFMLQYPHNSHDSKAHNELTKNPMTIEVAMDAMRRNLEQWSRTGWDKTEIDVPGFSVKNVEKETKLIGDDELINRFPVVDLRNPVTIKEPVLSFEDELVGNSAFTEIKEVHPVENARVREILSVSSPSMASYWGQSRGGIDAHIKSIKEMIESPEPTLPFRDELPDSMPDIRADDNSECTTFFDGFNALEELLALSGLAEDIPLAEESVDEPDLRKVRKMNKKHRYENVEHLEKDTFEISEEVINKTWKDISEAEPTDEQARHFANFYKRTVIKEPITFLDSWKYNDIEILELSGIETEDTEVEDDFRAALLRYVTNDDLPEGVNLGLNEEVLLINGAPTKISSKAIEMAFCGLAELMGPKESVAFVGNLVIKKLKTVF